jgi:ubiquinone/menaquinone biosynthesis C-methylase UbiE
MMLDLAGVKTGSSVLDVGAGAGDFALTAARRVHPTGHVLATDISASMLEIAAESAAHEALTNISTRVADAQHLDLASDSFDAAISRNCLMLIPDYRLALTEIRRVLLLPECLLLGRPPRCDCPHRSHPPSLSVPFGRHAVRQGATAIARAHD